MKQRRGNQNIQPKTTNLNQMKRITLIMLILLAVSTLTTRAIPDNVEEIKTVIKKAYIEGIHNGGSLDETRLGFHPGFELLILENNQLDKLPIEKWIEKIEQARKDPNTPQIPKTSVKFINIDCTGTAAVAKIELYREDKLIFTDYLSLYRFNEGWRIVSKIYCKH